MAREGSIEIPPAIDARVVARPAGAAASGLGRAAGSPAFDVTVAVLSALFLGGLYLDGWAHAHGRVDQSFFTPWHAIFYAGYAAVASVLIVPSLRNRARGLPSRHGLPAGYRLSLLGVLIFAVGGIGDMAWHLLFGIEVGVEALLSPTHLVLALGFGLIVTGPLRAAWRQPGPSSGWTSRAAVVLALACLLSLFTFFTMYAHPLVAPVAGTYHAFRARPGFGVASILVQTGLLMGPLLLVVRSWALPPGSLTAVLALNGVAMGFLNDDQYPLALVVAWAAGGLVADLLRAGLRPAAERPAAWRLFTFGVPAALFLCYFVALGVTEGIAWSIHLWAGSVVLAGVVGWLLGYLLVPPPSAETARVSCAGGGGP
jgi:hypothetical protein